LKKPQQRMGASYFLISLLNPLFPCRASAIPMRIAGIPTSATLMGQLDVRTGVSLCQTRTATVIA